jgi:GTP cyclohydrolase I
MCSEGKHHNQMLIQDVQQFAFRIMAVAGADSPDLDDTPARVAKAWQFWLKGYTEDPASVMKTFEGGSYDEMVVVAGIPVYSMCEHHFAPFFGVAHIGYIPSDRIIGLSKFARLVDIFARRLQVQERLTKQIADAISEHLNPVGVGVVLRCRHLCIESRGAQKPGTITYTSSMAGAIKDRPEARSEFMSFVRRADEQSGSI